MLGHLNEKKSLIYFASGLSLNGIDNQAQLHATVDAAIRAGVSFWPIDARGLVAQAPLGDATHGSPGGAAMYTGAAALAVTSGFQQSQDTLFALAGDTGGKALLDNNDLARGIVQAQHAISDYYILGYYTTNTALDGKFRKIKITVGEPLAATLDYRQGYCGGKIFGKFTTADKERQLEDALMLGDPITELTIAMEINYFQLNRAEYFVPVVVKIPGSELALAKKRGAEHTLIDFIGEIKDDYGGTTVTNLRDNVDIKLTDATAAELARTPHRVRHRLHPPPRQIHLQVPRPRRRNGPHRHLPDQLHHPQPQQGSQAGPHQLRRPHQPARRPQRRALQRRQGEGAKQGGRVNPLVQNGQKLIPSVTRVFSKSRSFYVYLQAYQPPAPASAASPTAPPSTARQPLIGFVSFYRDGKKSSKAPPSNPPPRPHPASESPP